MANTLSLHDALPISFNYMDGPNISDWSRLDIAPDGRWAVGFDEREYIRNEKILPTADIYRVDTTTGARTLIAGEGGAWPEENTGLDLAALAQARGLRLLCPHREGSLRVGESGPERLVAYRAGEWREVPNP
jgi:hypothetical protein